MGRASSGNASSNAVLSSRKRSAAFGRPNRTEDHQFPLHTVSVRVTEETEVHDGTYSYNSPGYPPSPSPKVISFQDGTSEVEESNSDKRMMV